MCWVDGHGVKVSRKPSPTGKAFNTPYHVCVRRHGVLLFNRGFIDYAQAVLFAHWCINNYETLKPSRRPYKDRHLLGPIVDSHAQTYSSVREGAEGKMNATQKN